MTRINVVPEDQLSDKHLSGEYHEISRVFELVRKFLQRGGSLSIPTEYRLGEGHVLFFYRRLEYIAARYTRLALEMRYRAFKRGRDSGVDMFVVAEIIQCARDSIHDERWWNDYVPTPEAIAINWQRLEERS